MQHIVNGGATLLSQLTAINQFLVVGLVESVCSYSEHEVITLNDATGRIQLHRRFCDPQAWSGLQIANTYVKVVMRSMLDRYMIVRLERISGPDDISYHYVEAAHTFLVRMQSYELTMPWPTM